MTAWLEGYAYSEGPAALASPLTAAPATAPLQAQNTVAVIHQSAPSTTIYARLAAPTMCRTALAEWSASLNLAAPAGTGATYVWVFDTSTRRVSVSGSVSFRPVFPGVVGPWLGFSAPLTGWATLWTAPSAPLGIVALLGVNVRPAEDAARIELQDLRLGRRQLTVWGNAQRFRVTVWCARADIRALESSCATGRVRVHQGSGGAYASAWSAANLLGYVDGYVEDVSQPRPMGSREDWWVVDLLLVRPR